MLLDHYVAKCLNNAQFYTQDVLEVGGTLADKFRNRIQLSETNVQELGFNLFWLSGSVWAGQYLQGSASGTSISLDTDQARQKPAYIGDFHTHPYEKKMGQGAKPAFSNGDLVEYCARPPLHKPISLHFVASSDVLYLLLFRGAPPAVPDFSVTINEAERLNEHVLNNDRFNRAFLSAHERTGMARWTAEKTAWSTFAPKAGAEFTEDTLRMNIELANHHGYELYSGSLAGVGDVSMRLLSNHVHCSSFTRFTDQLALAYEGQRRRGPITLM